MVKSCSSHLTGSPLPNDRRHVVLSTGTLRIARVAPHDQGQYECQAISPVGTVTTAVQLNIQQRGNPPPPPPHLPHTYAACVHTI